MDPLEILPIEIVQYIWKMLRKQDLLSCLAVNHSWREITQNVNQWRPYCDANELNDATSWYEIFLKECKLKWAWKVGSFNDGFVIGDCKLFCCSEEYIYVADLNNRLIKFHLSGKKIKDVEAPNDCKKIYLINDDIVLITNRIHYNEVIIFNDNLEELYRFESTPDTTYCFGGRLWFRSADDSRMIIIYHAKTENTDSHIERLQLDIGSTLVPITCGWSCLYQGVVKIISGDHQERIYKCDETPMSRIFMTIFSNDKDIIVIIDKKIIAGKHIYCTVFVYRNGTKLFRADVPKQLKFWCFSGDFLVLASFKDISTLHLTNGNLFIGDEIKGLDYSDYIYGIQNLFKYTNIGYIVVDHCAYFNVYDVKKQYNIIKINCARTPNMIATYFLNTLVCVSQMFVYCLKDTNQIEVKTIKL